MKIKTSELKDKALDWAVEKCLWVEGTARSLFEVKPYSTDWSQGGPTIEREHISTTVDDSGVWLAYCKYNYASEERFMHAGPTPLIAAMRCFMASRLGEEVEIPDELLQPTI